MKRDLVVLVPDADIEFGLRALLARHQALRIREIKSIEFRRHPRRDPGTCREPESVLEGSSREFERALVVLDEAWTGSPGRAAIESGVEARLARTFGTNVRCICICPEIEQWIWTDSPHLAAAVDWDEPAKLREWLEERNLWARHSQKPADPKSALDAVLRDRRIPHSSALFAKLGERMSVVRCSDPSFVKLVEVVRGWFPLDKP
jgi:hypothetical protein